MTDTRLPDFSVDSDFAEDIKAEAAKLGISYADYARLALRSKLESPQGTVNFSREFHRFDAIPEAPYRFDSTGPSLIRDIYATLNPATSQGDPVEARARLRKLRDWQVDFATINTTDHGDIVPPSYRALLGGITEDRPLFGLCAKGNLRDATPFTLPGFIPDDNLDSIVSEPGEGVNPSPASLSFEGATTVTPRVIEATFEVTRELMDSSNPAIDQVALAAMRESYNRQCEAVIAAAIATATAGTITDGRVPSGAMARTSTGAAIATDIKKAIAGFTHIRRRRPRRAVAWSDPAVAEELGEVLDGDHIPVGADYFWTFSGVPVDLSSHLGGSDPDDVDAVISDNGSVWAWSSPVLELTYSERSGPNAIDLALYGYFAAHVILPRGLSVIRHGSS